MKEIASNGSTFEQYLDYMLKKILPLLRGYAERSRGSLELEDLKQEARITLFRIWTKWAGRRPSLDVKKLGTRAVCQRFIDLYRQAGHPRQGPGRKAEKVTVLSLSDLTQSFASHLDRDYSDDIADEQTPKALLDLPDPVASLHIQEIIAPILGQPVALDGKDFKELKRKVWIALRKGGYVTRKAFDAEFPRKVRAK